MTTIYSAPEQLAALAAAEAAADGSKQAAYLAHWQVALGAGAHVSLYRDQVRVWRATLPAYPPIVGSSIQITTATQAHIEAADIDTGAWELRIENAANPDIYVGCTIARAAAENVGSLDDDLPSSGTLTIGTLRFNAPQLDAVVPAPVQASSVGSGSQVAGLSLAMTGQPVDGNKIIVPIAYYEGFRGIDDPTDIGATVWLDVSDLASLAPNEDGSGTITAAGQLVRSIDNKGSVGGRFSSASGWYLREATNGALYLEMDGLDEFVSTFASSAAIGVSAGEVIAACRPDNYAAGGDSWYGPSVWQADDGCAGISLQSISTCRAFNLGGGDDYATLAYVAGVDQVFTWQHSGGYVTGAVGFASTLPTGTASTSTASLDDGMAIGGVYHGSFPRAEGRFFGLIAKDSALTQTQRDYAQWMLHRKMFPEAKLAAPGATDSASPTNHYVVTESRVDAAERLWVGQLVCHSVASGSGGYTVDVTMPAGGKCYYPVAVAAEFSGLVGSVALDVTGDAANDGSAGSLEATTGATAQAVDLVVSVHALHNGDSAAGMTAPSGYTSLGAAHDAAAVLGFVAGYKVTTAAGAQAATASWDAGSAGGAAGVLAAYKAGVNTDEPTGGGGGGGGGGGSTELTLNSMASDMNTLLEHEYYLHGVPTSYDWGHAAKIGSGANAPGSYPDPHTVIWGITATGQGYTPGSHNWRVAIISMHHHARIGGNWQVVQPAITAPGDIGGAEYTDWLTDASVPASVYTGAGMEEVFLDDEGSSYHFFSEYRAQIPAAGTEHRVLLIRASLTLVDGGGADERSAAEVVLMAAADYYAYVDAVWPNNTEAVIGRATKPAIWPSTSWHSAHTMTDDADIAGYLAWVATIGILD